MLKNAKSFYDFLMQKELSATIKELSDGDVKVSFPYDGKNTQSIFTGDDGEYVSMYTVYESVPEDKTVEALIACNELNSKFKWLKFYVDDDNDLIVQDDAVLSPDTAAEECFELLLRRISILKDARPVILKALFL